MIRVIVAVFARMNRVYPGLPVDAVELAGDLAAVIIK